MGIKDNFSQAVKELWKKDGQDDSPARQSGQPTELDNYLKQGAEQQPASEQPAQNVDASGGVPLETPYYRQTPQAQQNTPLQNTIPDGEAGVNMNVQNIRRNFGQNNQNAQPTQPEQPAQETQNTQDMQPVQDTAQSAPQQPQNMNAQAAQGMRAPENNVQTAPAGRLREPKRLPAAGRLCFQRFGELRSGRLWRRRLRRRFCSSRAGRSHAGIQ